MSLLLSLGLLLLALCTLAGAAVAARHSSWRAVPVEQIAAVGGYLMAYFTMVSGFIAWMRARSMGGAAPRLLALAVLFVTGVGPWIAMAIAGLLGSNHSSAIVFAAPSPFILSTMLEALEPGSLISPKVLTAGAGAAACWALIGTALHGLAAGRVHTLLEAQRTAEEELDAVLAAEDAPAESPENAEGSAG
jgi:hypothetical protein